jgi:hypothetical protein
MALKRKDFADYLNVSKTQEASYVLLGYGVESLDEEPGAQTDTTCYINDETSSTTITKYETQFPYTSEIIIEQEAIKSLYLTGRNHETGTDAERDYVRVDMFDPVSDSAGTYNARKFRISNEVSTFSGEGGEKMKVEGTLHAIGDPIQGTFNVTTKTFTPTTTQTSNTQQNQATE